ncbi:MAG: hypothetical protein ACOH2M_26185 [Cypionkella sp.]
MAELIFWPAALLEPASITVSPVPFTRSGGRTLGGIERNTRTDRGFLRVAYSDVTLFTPAMRRTWNAIRQDLGGKAGLIVVPVWSFDSAPYASGEREPEILTPHDDDAPFDDGSLYQQGSIDIEMASFAPLASTVVTLRLINATSAAGIRFSYQHAMYETGRIISQPGANTFQVSVSPAIRQAVPAGASLECDLPTVLCHLADDRGMDIGLGNDEINSANVEFVEAVDYWNSLALGLEE